MTSGELLFYAGIGLFGLTVILAIVFLIKKPKYRPENAAGGDGQTVPLRNGYPTEPMTIRYGMENKRNTEKASQATEALFTAEGTVLLDSDAAAAPMGTQLLPAETELLPAETELLPQETQLLCEETALLK